MLIDIYDKSLLFAYNVVLADPPWPQQKGNIRKARPNQDRNLDYKTLSLDSIKNHLKAADLLVAYRSAFFVWTIDKFLQETEDMMKRLGWTLHARIIWDKGNGVAPAFTVRFSHEYLLWYYQKGHMLKPTQAVRGKFTTVLREPSTIHSRKPVCAYQMLEAMFPKTKKLELYARNQRPGWDCWGDQVNMFDQYKHILPIKE